MSTRATLDRTLPDLCERAVDDVGDALAGIRAYLAGERTLSELYVDGDDLACIGERIMAAVKVAEASG